MNWRQILWVAAVVTGYITLATQVVDLKSRVAAMEDTYARR